MSTVYIRFTANGSINSRRAPVLERLIANASIAVRTADWRAEAFEMIAPPGAQVPPLAAAALHAEFGAVSGAWVCIAAPVHCVAGMSNVTLPEGGILELTRMEAESLAASFNSVFGDAGVRLVVGRSSLFCVFDRELEVTMRDPEDAMGRDVFSFQAAGKDASRLRRLASEMEMWLFEHEVNQVRATRALPPITGLWLWGGGATLQAMPTVHGWTAGSDPFFAAFHAEVEFPDGRDNPGVVVCADRPGSTTWPEVEARWLGPAMTALQSGRIERLVLSAGDRRFNVAKGIKWRFWRRPRPWWESFAQEGGESHGVP